VTGVWQHASRIRWRGLSTSASAAALALVLVNHAAAAPYVDGSCAGVQPGEIAFELRAEPAEVPVGDIVEVEAHIASLPDGRAAIPLFRLLGAEPAFAVEAQDSSYPALAYAHYRLRAIQPGDATLRVAVNFATTTGCGDTPSLVFLSAHSQLVTIRVRDIASGEARTVTPTRTMAPDTTPRQRFGRR